ncbi:MAG: hypothetical protein KAT85_06805, partial [candidate division Zixibacteria bacterium]|nr:hypothetical protein [candidate division Zixibacteria bacterium]
TPGTMRFCPSVIIDDYIYFGGDGGYIYKLNKHTGSTAAFAQTLYGNPVWVSPSTDGDCLYFGCSVSAIGGDAGGGNNEGALYKYDSNLSLIAPYSGNIGWDEGVTGGAAYSAWEDALYFQVECTFSDADPLYVDGFTQKADASTMGQHPDNTFYPCGLGTNANPAIHPYVGLVFFGHSTPRYRIWFTGISCMTSDMHLLWNDFTRGDMTNPAAVTCDGYVFWGTRDHPNGTFNCSRGYDGKHMLGYELTGYGFGSAIAKYETDPGIYQVFVAQTQLWSDCGTGGGRLAMYSVGEPRGRLQIPSREVVIDPAIDFTDPDGTERTAELFCNNGCAGLKYCLRLEADPGFPTRTLTSHVNPQRMARIEKEADKLIEYSIDDFGE